MEEKLSRLKAGKEMEKERGGRRKAARAEHLWGVLLLTSHKWGGH